MRRVYNGIKLKAADFLQKIGGEHERAGVAAIDPGREGDLRLRSGVGGLDAAAPVAATAAWECAACESCHGLRSGLR